MLCDERGVLTQSAVSGLVSHRGTAGWPGGRAEQVPLDVPAKGSMEVVLKADTSQEIGLLALASPFLWEFVDLKAKGVVCHKLGRTSDVGYWAQGTERKGFEKCQSCGLY